MAATSFRPSASARAKAGVERIAGAEGVDCRDLEHRQPPNGALLDPPKKKFKANPRPHARL
jgi:hypothetical protein